MENNTLGQRICENRKRISLSQGELADMLEVSRQSVSKWETDTATPDIERLIKLADIFGVTLDELIKGATAEKKAEVFVSGVQESFTPEKHSFASSSPSPSPLAYDEKNSLARTIAGTVLLCFGVLFALLLLILGGGWFSLVFALPFLLCGVICLSFRSHVGLWCTWAVYFSVDLYFNIATGISRGRVFLTLIYEPSMNYLILIFSWIMVIALALLFVITVLCFKKLAMPYGKNSMTILLCCVAVIIASHAASHLYGHFIANVVAQNFSLASGYIMRVFSLVSFFLQWIRIAAFSIIVVVLCAILRFRHRESEKSA